MCNNLSHYHNVKISCADKASTDAVTLRRPSNAKNTEFVAGSFEINSVLLRKGSVPDPCYETCE
jgi:hypothetical protein